MKKRSERRKHCTLAVVRRSQKMFAPPQTPSQGRGTAKIQSAGDGHYLHLQTQFGEDRCTQFQVIVVTDSPTHPYTNTHTHPAKNKQTGPIIIHCAAASTQCKNNNNTCRKIFKKFTTRLGELIFDSGLDWNFNSADFE